MTPQSVFNHQRRELMDSIETHTRTLVRGTGTYEGDERIRGIVHGLTLALDLVIDTEGMARRGDSAED